MRGLAICFLAFFLVAMLAMVGVAGEPCDCGRPVKSAVQNVSGKSRSAVACAAQRCEDITCTCLKTGGRVVRRVVRR